MIKATEKLKEHAMSTIKPVNTDTAAFTPQKSFLVLFDSDGCVMDSMTPKHRLCFLPLLIKEWNLEAHEKEIKEIWERINLYSSSRGINRFRGLALTLKEVNADLRPIVGIGNLLHWTEGDELSEASLMRKIEANHEVDIFKKALAWSRGVNRASAELDMPPFKGAREALALASRFADVAVVSGASPDALYHEWTRHKLTKDIDLLLGQNAGKKKRVIAALTEKGYAPTNILMCGDSLFDLQAARLNKIHFFPIVAGREEESWHLAQEAFGQFKDQSYGCLEAELVTKFEDELNGGRI